MFLTMILMICRKITGAQQKIMNRIWTGWGPSETMGERIRGKNFGIIGMGRIGKAVAKRLSILGVKIFYHNRNRLKNNEEKVLKAKYFENLDSFKFTVFSI